MATTRAVDYSVYLVTDARAGAGLEAVVEAALRGGATVVQLRDKQAGPAALAATARRLLGLTRRRGVPLLVNDNVEVARDVDCDGVHLGQDDSDVGTARRLLGPLKIIGASAHTPAQAVAACEAGADYLGLGAVFATPTKPNAAAVIGPASLRAILAALAAAGHADVPTVCIGGLDAARVGPVLAEARTGTGAARPPPKALDGVAVVSAIFAAPDPAAAAAELRAAVLRARLPDVLARVARMAPLSHNMTNLVVQNLAANVALAVGASPIMANYAREAPDLARLGGALVINTGTVTPDGLDNHVHALRAYNDAARPIVLDPVGAGATAVRRHAVATLLSAGHFAVIKGNASELLAVYGPRHGPAQRGVDDSSGTRLDLGQRAALARAVARRHGCVAVLTGAVDVVSDACCTVCLANGHPLLTAMTGSGCSLGTVLSATLAAAPAEPLLAAVAGVALFGIAAERAAAHGHVRGPGTYVPALIDELYAMRMATVEGDLRWLVLAKLEVLLVDDDAMPLPGAEY